MSALMDYCRFAVLRCSHSSAWTIITVIRSTSLEESGQTGGRRSLCAFSSAVKASLYLSVSPQAAKEFTEVCVCIDRDRHWCCPQTRKSELTQYSWIESIKRVGHVSHLFAGKLYEENSMFHIISAFKTHFIAFLQLLSLICLCCKHSVAFSEFVLWLICFRSLFYCL